ncbi:MAG: porin [Rhodospirillaceae bacterium]|nr:porin [Rhodospirillaceae bacterium]MBT7294092.1 porin [Rhodospirillaceae bacterium]
MFAVPAAADEIADLKAENDALKGQVETLAGDLQVLRDAVMKNQQAVADVKAASGSSKSIIHSGKKDTELSISGQVNRMVFYADNGDQARWFHADNDRSSTRLRFVGKSKLDDVWSAGSNIEVQFESNSTGDVTIDQNTATAASNSFTERKLELWFSNKDLGKLTFGQGPSASDGSVEEDLSGTGVISAAGFADLGTSLLFRVSGTGGTSSGVTVGSLFSDQDGLSRDDRLRYDTPTFAGTKLSTSWVDGDEWDVAARYGREFDGTEVALAASYWDAAPTSQKTGFGLSASVKAPFGTSLTGSYSSEDLEAAGRDDEEFWYVKLGHDFKMNDLGGTAVSVNYAETQDQGANNREGSFYSLAAVQKVSKISADLYAIIGVYDADLPGVQTEDITIGGFGARVKF